MEQEKLNLILKEIRGEVQENGWYRGFCPWHEMDGSRHNPSLVINPDGTYFRCTTQNCSDGHISKLANKLGFTTLFLEHCESLDKVQGWAGRLQEDKPQLLNKLGWSLEVCNYMGIGWTGKLFTIPIFLQGKLVQLWKYKNGAPQPQKYKAKVKGAPSAVFPAMYWLEKWKGQDIYLCEGYGDTLAMLSKGFCAVTAGGKNHWNREHIEQILSFPWENIYIVPDNDKAGTLLGAKLKKLFSDKGVDIIWLGIPAMYKDISDYLKMGGKVEELEPRVVNPETCELDMSTIEDISLSKLDESDSRQFLRVRAVVSGKYESPYRIPKKFIVECDESSDKVCPVCPYGLGAVVELDKSDQIALVGATKEKMDGRVKRTLKKPARCPGCRITYSEEMDYVEELRVRLPPDEVNVDETNIDRRTFYFGTNIAVNETYDFEGFVTSHPESQEVCFVALFAYPANLDACSQKTCPILPYSDWREMVKDLAYNVTYIYNRPELHLFALASLFSPLFVNYQGVTTRTYLESLLIGDSECGKSQVIKKLFGFYNVGQVVDSAQATSAGLLGGVSDNDRGRRFLSPGILSCQDRKIVGIEEVGNLPDQVMKTLRETRSSGIINIGKIEKAVYSARTRLICTANPRGGRKTVQGYNYGIECLFSVIPDPADQRRFDVVHVVQDVLNTEEIDRNAQKMVLPAYTKEIARKHLRWVWDLRKEDIFVTEEAENAIITGASILGKRGHVSLPILTKTSTATKLLKLGCAIAALEGSCNSARDVLMVKECHIIEAGRLFNHEYDNPPNGYFGYCDEKRAEDSIADKQALIDTFRKVTDPLAMVENLKSINKFNGLHELIQFCTLDTMTTYDGRRFANALLANNCLKKYGTEFYKTPAFIEFLKNCDSDIKEMISKNMVMPKEVEQVMNEVGYERD